MLAEVKSSGESPGCGTDMEVGYPDEYVPTEAEEPGVVGDDWCECPEIMCGTPLVSALCTLLAECVADSKTWAFPP